MVFNAFQVLSRNSPEALSLPSTLLGIVNSLKGL